MKYFLPDLTFLYNSSILIKPINYENVCTSISSFKLFIKSNLNSLVNDFSANYTKLNLFHGNFKLLSLFIVNFIYLYIE